jgi:hypothetical protein
MGYLGDTVYRTNSETAYDRKGESSDTGITGDTQSKVIPNFSMLSTTRFGWCQLIFGTAYLKVLSIKYSQGQKGIYCTEMCENTW